jgi:hypothetical protein
MEEARPGNGSKRMNPDGNERLTATVGVVLIVLTVVELATLLFGLQQFLSLHVFVGLVLIPPVLLKLASTGWRFTRYYTRNAVYRLEGAPQLAMRLLAPLLVAATVVLFGSGIAMGVLHGQSLQLARDLHGPASVAWMLLLGVHVLVYLRRALVSAKEDLVPVSRSAVTGARARTFLLVASLVAGLAAGVSTLSVEHRWLHLPPKHDHRDDSVATRRPSSHAATENTSVVTRGVAMSFSRLLGLKVKSPTSRRLPCPSCRLPRPS